MISYRSNWMGPISLDWYENRGLVKTVTEVLTIDCLFFDKKAGDTITYKEPSERWCAGRIDIYGTDSVYPDEMSLPMMKDEDWNRFSNWLDTFETDDVWTLEQLVEMYERSNPRITWWVYENSN